MTNEKLFLVLMLVHISGLRALKCDSTKFKFYNKQSLKCLRCDKCVAGEGRNKTETVVGSPEFGALKCALCRPCQDDFFNDKEARECKPCKHCGERNMYETKPCTSTSNSKCSKRPPRTTRKPTLPFSISPPGIQNVENAEVPQALPNTDFSKNRVDSENSIVSSTMFWAFIITAVVGVLVVGAVATKAMNRRRAYNLVSRHPTPNSATATSTSLDIELTAQSDVVDATYAADKEQTYVKQPFGNSRAGCVVESTAININEKSMPLANHEKNKTRTTVKMQPPIKPFNDEMNWYETYEQCVEVDAIPHSPRRHEGDGIPSEHAPLKCQNSNLSDGKIDQIPSFRYLENTVISKQEQHPLKAIQSMELIQGNSLDPVGGLYQSELCFISKHLVNKQNYKEFTRTEGLPEYELECIECNNSSEKERAFKVLEKWMQVKGEMATRKNTKAALKAIGRSDIIDLWISEYFKPDLNT